MTETGRNGETREMPEACQPAMDKARKQVIQNERKVKSPKAKC